MLDRTPFTTWGGYGGLALRGPGDWHDTRLLLADGRAEERVLGEPAPWCALTGIVGADGAEAPAGSRCSTPLQPPPPGALVWQHPGRDLRRRGLVELPQRGVPVPRADAALAAGDELRIDHRVVVHDGEWDHADIAALHDAWEPQDR